MIIDSNVQMVLIICLTIIACYIINCLKSDSKGERENRDNERFGYCKSPRYPPPKRPGTSTADAIRNIKPPSTGSGIKPPTPQMSELEKRNY